MFSLNTGLTTYTFAIAEDAKTQVFLNVRNHSEQPTQFMLSLCKGSSNEKLTPLCLIAMDGSKGLKFIPMPGKTAEKFNLDVLLSHVASLDCVDYCPNSIDESLGGSIALAVAIEALKYVETKQGGVKLNDRTLTTALNSEMWVDAYLTVEKRLGYQNSDQGNSLRTEFKTLMKELGVTVKLGKFNLKEVQTFTAVPIATVEDTATVTQSVSI